MSQTERIERYWGVDASGTAEVVAGRREQAAAFDLEAVFCAQFARIARAVARVVRDHGRAEELAVEAFVKLLRHPRLHSSDVHVEAWLYRTAIRLALDELRRRKRHARFEQWLRFVKPAPAPSPEEMHAAGQEQERVREVLSGLPRRQAELLLLRSQELSYSEIASAMNIHPASLGKLLSRAQHSFRKEYTRRYGLK
jgi:RNA polymerase sigma-70 factor, ECF subfamily